MNNVFSRIRPKSLADALRASLWPVPLLAVVVSVLVGVGLPRLDAALDSSLSETVSLYLFDGGPGAARSVLEAIAGSLITVTSLTFSLTVVTLQLASSQFSPRLLRTFSRDRFVHVTLAMFLATFTFALTVLRSVRDSADVRSAFVPEFAVTLALVLTLASVVALVLFLAHLAREIRVETMLLSVHQETRAAFDRVLGPESGDATVGRARTLPPPEDAAPVLAESSGFLVEVGEGELVAAMERAGARLSIDRLPGEFLVAGVPFGFVWPCPVEGRDAAFDLDEVRSAVVASVQLAQERTAVQDVAFGLRQLTDVVLKGLSPGINDPTTAVHALGHAASLLCSAAGRELGPSVVEDSTGCPRVVLRRPMLSHLLGLVVEPTCRYGASDPDVLVRLVQLLREVAWRCSDASTRAAVVDQLATVRRVIAAASDPFVRARLQRHTERVEHALRGRWYPDTEEAGPA